MVTLDNGVIIDESRNAKNFTLAKDVPAVFGFAPTRGDTTIHHWGEPGQKFDDVVRYLESANARQVSAHYVLQDDRVTCLVSPWDTAWHCGNAKGNATSIGIECRPEMTAGDLETLASLIRYLETLFGSQRIWLHSNWVSTACPGKYSGQVDNIINMVNGEPHSTGCKCACNS